MDSIHDILKTYWGWDTFRPLQEEIITSVLDGKDTLALLPTGGGKSLCYQVPALSGEGICLVISPLIALMKDQVENLRKRGILALSIYSGQSRRQIVQTLKNAAYGPYKFLYVSPERIETSLFLEYLPALHINLIAVDEAHCISQWGYDFRPSYLRIAELREHLPGVPVLALTASATAAVQEDICEKLRFPAHHIIRQSFERANLSYSLFRAEAKAARLTEVLTKVPGSAIVYCRSRKRTVDTANLLQLHGLSATSYHAGLSSEERAARQGDWIDNKVKIMVCTNAFGMGIDKPDVRLVVHLDIPDSLENYYQEAGRAGRDGKKSYAVLLYEEKDLAELEELPDKRFPSFALIREVYRALSNFLQVPVHTGQDVSYTFRYETFVKNFKLDSFTALYAIKALEGDGWFDFNEKSFAPSTLVFTTTKRELYSFQEQYPQHEPLMTTLLRTYEGIFDVPVFIFEKAIAGLMRCEEEEIRNQLKELTALRMVKYKPQTEEPQLILRKNRVAAEDLSMNLYQYNKRKEAFAARVRTMLEYTGEKGCRSRFINRYFGDEGSKDCGICDNCLKGKATPLGGEEFSRISTAIRKELAAHPLTLDQLQGRLPGVPRQKTEQVLRFLQSENVITTDTAARLRLK